MTDGTPPAVEVRSLSVSFDRWGQRVEALRGLSLTIAPGEWVMLVGHNGSGKSTLLQVLTGQIPPTSGAAMVFGRDPAPSVSRIAESAFLVRQDPRAGSAPDLTIFENLWAADPEARGAGRRACRRRYAELLRPVGLDGRLEQLVQTLSGGERQLLTLAIALLRPGSLVLLDEPFSALDPRNARTGLAQVEALHAAGKTIVHVTHDETSASRLGTRTIVLKEGRVAYDRHAPGREVSEVLRHWHHRREGAEV